MSDKRKRIRDVVLEMVSIEPLALDDLVDALGIVFPRMKLTNARVAQMLRGAPGISREVVVVNRTRTPIYSLSMPSVE